MTAWTAADETKITRFRAVSSSSRLELEICGGSVVLGL
jgi:hypothetical protein